MKFVDGYLDPLIETLANLPKERIQTVIDLMHEVRQEGRTVFIMGNGGSASTASHFVADLAKNTRQPDWPNFKVIGLTDNMAVFSAYANDEGYEHVFAQQLASFVKPNDLVIGISASGNSTNVLKAIELANQVGAVTVGFTGFDGGLLSRLVDIDLHVDSEIIEHVEDIHLMFEHLICKALREKAQEPLQTAVLVSSNGQGEAYPSSRPSLMELDWINRELAAQETDQDGLLRLALKLSLEKLGAQSGSILLLNESGEVADVTVAYSGQVSKTAPDKITEMVKFGLAGWVIENRQAALVADTNLDPRWLPRDWDQEEGTRSAVCVPLMDQDRVAGVLTLVQPSARQFDQTHLVILAAIGMYVSYNSIGGGNGNGKYRHEEVHREERIMSSQGLD